MKKLLFGLLIVASAAGNAQTGGTLSFSFTPTAHTGYSGYKNVLAVWIQTGSGSFVKTRLRYVGWGTADHLPTWATNSGGSSNNAMTGCNTVSATTGATLTSFSTKTITWDGTDVNGNVVADGTYKVTIQETWNHGGGTTTRSFTFTKGSSSDSQTPSNDGNFTNISLTWTPSATTGVEDNTSEFPVFELFPNPATDLITVNYSNSNSVKIINELGDVVYSTNLSSSQIGTKTIDMSSFARGLYHVLLINDKGTIAKKVILQ